MKKIIVAFLALVIISALILFAFRDQLSLNTIINNIEKKTGLEIKLKDKNTWIFYPSITLNNKNVSIKKINSSLKINKANLNIRKSYWPTTPVNIILNAPSSIYEGIEINDLTINLKYFNSIIEVENIDGKIIEGNFTILGQLNLNDAQSFDVQGNFNDISLNTILKQSREATWERVNIKLSSSNFNLSGQGKNRTHVLNSLKGVVPITGSLYFSIKKEERFGAALLSLLVEKFPNISPISQSIDFLLSEYANISSMLTGKLIINGGYIYAEDILIVNNGAKSTLKGSYNFLKDTINGTIYFYKKDEIFLKADLKGKISNPQILLGGKIFKENINQQSQDIKQLFEKGLNSLLNNLLEKDNE